MKQRAKKMKLLKQGINNTKSRLCKNEVQNKKEFLNEENKLNSYDENEPKRQDKLVRKSASKNLPNSYFIFFFLLILMLPQLYFFNKIELKQLSYDNCIVLTVAKNGDENRIISQDASREILPNKIKINDESEITSDIKKRYSLSLEINTVTLTWDNPLTSCRNMFKNVEHITNIDLSNFDFSSVKDLGSFFDGCSNVQSINMMNGNAVNVENMDWMFAHCGELTNLVLTNFKTSSSLTTMNGAFYGCSSLQNYDFSNFDTTHVTNMAQLFSDNHALISLDLSSFHTPALPNMYGMFDKCYNLKNLKVSNFDTTNVENMVQLFSENYNIESLDLSNFHTPALTNMYGMFDRCTNLKNLDISHFVTTNVKIWLVYLMKIII